MMLEPQSVKQMPVCDVPVFAGSKLSKRCMNSLLESLTQAHALHKMENKIHPRGETKNIL